MRAFTCILLALAVTAPAMSATTRGKVGAQREASLLQTWDRELSHTSNPIIRVVGLLKDMQATIQKEQEEDEGLHKTLMCWCNGGAHEKKGEIDESKMKIEQLEAAVENLSAREKELTTKIKELEDGFASNKAELAEATALRQKQLKEFHGMEIDSIQAIENLKAALVVLDKGSFAQSPSFVQLSAKKMEPWMAEMKTDEREASFDYFLRSNSLDDEAPQVPPTPKFLQQETGSSQQALSDDAIVKRAKKTMQAFLQAHHQTEDLSQDSGEIIGIMKQMKETMEADLKEAQATEQERAASFQEMRTAKSQEIDEQEKMAEQKEDELATTSMDLAEAKEDLEQTTNALTEFEKFLANLDDTCKTADANFAERKKSRLAEIEAVSETIEILTSDEARDAANGTYGAASFLQVSSMQMQRRQKRAAALLRRAALKSRDPSLALLATNAELDGFEKVKKAMDDLVKLLQTQQADEVKKNDWCKDELQENEMNTLKKEDEQADLQAKIENLKSSVKTFTEEIKTANAAIDQAYVDLQRASMNRKSENMDFQKVVADQTTTREILLKALDKLANFYDKGEFLQKAQHKQTPPVVQAEYKPSGGAGGIMSMLEKLIAETKTITAESKKAESDAQKAYEQLIADTNASVKDLMNEITTKEEATSQAKKDTVQAESDLQDTTDELEGLAKYNADLHEDCDYVLKNFDTRQQARAAEIASIKEAKAILSGAK
eukprot:gnl/TRDRNA2_/TRDRNA2_177260_c2_seq1.p1 gnl/TRDRNA2_/TRDRNA2_177260_c2~~gnl/TRDRNA2_/TRDRNA2_177260_c2_seq1.p1  ORF type:complete len:722 (+),score=280.85 gnl/TRDRNA2_/TRDRNA2_177260_c2_seq1:76-2241(+)